MRPRRMIPDGLRALPSLRACTAAELAAVAAHAEVVHLDAGATLAGPCRRAREVVVILTGEAVAEPGGATLVAGDSLGADEVDRGVGFTVRWRARTPLEVLVLPAPAYRFGSSAVRTGTGTRLRQRRRGRMGAAMSAGSARQSTPGTSM